MYTIIIINQQKQEIKSICNDNRVNKHSNIYRKEWSEFVCVCLCVCVCGRTAAEKDLRCDILSSTCDVIGGTNTSCFIFA